MIMFLYKISTKWIYQFMENERIGELQTKILIFILRDISDIRIVTEIL